VCGVGRKSCTFLRRPRDKGVRSGPQALIAPLSAPVPVRSGAGRDAPFRKGNQDARSLLDLTPTGPSPAARPTPLVVVHPGRATTSCTLTCTPRRSRGDGARDVAPTSEPALRRTSSLTREPQGGAREPGKPMTQGTPKSGAWDLRPGSGTGMDPALGCTPRTGTAPALGRTRTGWPPHWMAPALGRTPDWALDLPGPGPART
jgi:hypothetical protein